MQEHTEMRFGIVQYYSQRKRFGFVSDFRALPGSKDVFFHLNDAGVMALASSGNKESGALLRPMLKLIYIDEDMAEPPKQHDKLAFVYEDGEHKDAHRKARIWAFDNRQMRKFVKDLSDYLTPIEAVNWHKPQFIAIDPETTNGWFPATYYRYYPISNSLIHYAYKSHLDVHICNFSSNEKDGILLFKQGDIVVTGRITFWNFVTNSVDYQARWNGSKFAVEQIFGVIPQGADNGFYFYDPNLGNWAQCSMVRIRVKNVIVNNRAYPSIYSFIGLISKQTRKLIPSQTGWFGYGFGDTAIFALTYSSSVANEQKHSNLKIKTILTDIHKDGWFSESEKLKWIDTDIIPIEDIK